MSEYKVETRMADPNDLTVGRYQVWKRMPREQYEQFVESVRASGVMVDVHVDGDMNIIDGHHRYTAAIEAGLPLIPVKVHAGAAVDQCEYLAYTLNHHREISRKEKQEAAVRLRNSGKSYRMIGEMLGVGVATIHRWVAEEHAAVPNETPAVTADSADGKAYPATQTPQSELDERALRIKAHVTSGMTREQAAKTEGVSLRTAYKDLARVDERLAEIPDLGEVPTFEFEGDPEPERQTASGGRFDPKIYEMLEYTARTAAEAKMYTEGDTSADNRLLHFIHEHLRPFLGRYSASFGTFMNAKDDMAKSLYLEQVRLLAEIGFRVLISIDYESFQEIMEVVKNEETDEG